MLMIFIYALRGDCFEPQDSIPRPIVSVWRKDGRKQATNQCEVI